MGQGNFHNPVDNGGLVVDLKNSNTVYVVYQDGKDKSVSDLPGPCDDYHFSNIYFTRFSDGGMTWPDPVVPGTYMGYYNTPCVDSSGKNPGVIAPYGDYAGGNGNVEIQKVTQLP